MTTTTPLGLNQPVTAPDTLLGLTGADERLLAVIAAAAPFDERESGVHFVPVRTGGRRRLADRAQRWLRAAVADDDVARRALLLHRQQTGRDLGAGLLDVKVRNPGRLPDWAYALVDFLLSQPPTPADDRATELVGGVLVAFQRAAVRLTGVRRVDEHAAELRGVRLTHDAADDVGGQLVHRLLQVTDSAIAFELQIADGAQAPSEWYSRPGIDVSRLGWLARLESLPGLAYLIGVTCLNYKRNVAEVFDRLYADLPTLRRELWAWADPGPLASYSGDSGDLHDGGRTVSLLTFTGGQRVVYKPKDLRSVAGFMDVLTYLNSHDLPLPLATRRVLLRDGYGWEEFVVARPCEPGEEPSRFYRRLGMLARLSELLECRDLWLDNLIAIGDSPMFIDLENVLQGRMRKPALLGDRTAALWNEIEESIAKSGMISCPRIGTPGKRAHDIGCVAPIQEQLAVDPEGFPFGWEAPPYRPVVGGLPVDPAAYTDDVVTGYREMEACLAANVAGLSDERGPLHLLAGARVRYIFRSTWDYIAMLRVATGPLALTDGVARELVLARLFRGTREVLRSDPGRVDCLEIIEREIEMLRRLDIPLFQSVTTNSDVSTPDGATVEDHFTGTAWARVTGRLADLAGLAERGGAGVPAREDILRTCLDFAARDRPLWTDPPGDSDGPAHPRARGVHVYDPRVLRPEVDHARLLAGACAAADDVIAAAVPVGEGRFGWIGVVHYPAYGLDQVEPLHGDLLTGTAGIAVFLAELYQTTGRPAYWAFAQDALAATTEFVSVSGRSSVYARLSGGRVPVGGFVGTGSAIYALARCGHVIGDAYLLDQAEALVPAAAALVADGGGPAEVIMGRAGLLLALLKLIEARPSPAAEQLAASLYEQLTTDLAKGLRPVYPDGVRPIVSLPSGAAGVAMALARYAAARRPADLDVIAALDPATLTPTLTLTPGQRLAGIALAKAAGRPLPAHQPVADAGGTADLLDRVELGLAAAWATADETQREAHRAAAHTAMGTLLTRHASHGRWLPDLRRPDRMQLSAVDGISAVGLACLALAEDDVTSLRTMA